MEIPRPGTRIEIVAAMRRVRYVIFKFFIKKIGTLPSPPLGYYLHRARQTAFKPKTKDITFKS